MANQLSPKEQKELEEYIKKAYSVDFSKENKMFRDDIKAKVIEALAELYIGNIEDAERSDLEDLAIILDEEYGTDIQLSQIMEWQDIGDIVDTVEIELQNKVGEER
jgi:acyl carrier protein